MRLLLLLLMVSSALAEPRVTYVGDGRYVCSGSLAECAPYDRGNREREVARERDRMQREMLDEQRKQTRYLEESLRKERYERDR